MILSKQNISSLKRIEGLEIPGEHLFSLPEKVLQFGTGVLLRGLPDYFIDKANKQNIFNGRVVMVKSTDHGDADTFTKQDNLYTQLVRGIENGKRFDEVIINASVSRVLSASAEWPFVLECAANPQMQIIISNTTEVGIVLQRNENVYANPPQSFPGKLLAFLLERYKRFNGDAESGMVIVPTELIPENGLKLKNIVIELAKQNHADSSFIEWVNSANDFCNSLVDRIVPGQLHGAEKATAESKLGYKDNLVIMSEVYRLWAIETSKERTRKILSFSKADKGVVIADDITEFRELKLRLLNGSHTFSCGLAVLMSFTTVKQAMDDNVFFDFISNLMREEIVPAIVNNNIKEEDALQFTASVLDRYKDPFLEHQWLSITLQYSSKMKMRNVPLLLWHYQKINMVPRYMALGFAAYLLFMKSEKSNDHTFTGHVNTKHYIINDDKAAVLHQLWLSANTINFTEKVLADKDLWGTDLNALPGFSNAVSENIKCIQHKGIAEAIKECAYKQTL